MKNYQIIETSRDSHEKCNDDPKQNGFSIRFWLHPGTKGADGNPLDAMLLSEYKTFPGCHATGTLIGYRKPNNQGCKNDPQ